MEMLSKTKKLSFAAFAAFLLVFGITLLPLNASMYVDPQVSSDFASFGIPTAKVQEAYNASTYEWVEHGNGAARTNFQEGEAPNTDHVLWAKNYLAILHPPLVVNNFVITAANQQGKADPFLTEPEGKPTSRWLFALNKDTGDLVWATNMTYPLYSGWPDGCELLKVDDSHIMYISNGHFLIHDTNTGNLVKDFDTEGFLASPGVYVEEIQTWFGIGSFTATQAQTIEAWEFSDVLNPTRLWRSDPLEMIDSRFTYENGRIHVGSNEVTEYCLDAKTGKLIWYNDNLGFTGFFAAYSNGTLYRASVSNFVFAFEAATGKLLWQFQPSEPGGFVSPSIAYGRVYSMNVNGKFYSLNATDGSLLWTFQAFAPNATAPVVIHYPTYTAIADGKLYCLTADRSTGPPVTGLIDFTCIDAYSGELIWDNHQAEMRCPAIAYGNVYGTDFIYDRGIFADDVKIADGIGGNVWCFGKGPVTIDEVYTDTVKLYNLPYINVGGETSIIGSVTDRSPANPGKPAALLPVSLSWYLPDGKTGQIAEVTTDYDGKFFYKWSPTQPGQYTIIADSNGSVTYQKPAMVITEISVEPAPFTVPVFFYVIGGIVIIFIVAIVVMRIRKRKPEGETE